MRLKHVREPGLLAPVGARLEWTQMTPEDDALIRRLLPTARSDRERINNGEYVARVHHFFKWAGIKEPITEEDRQDISQSIRSSGTGLHSLDVRFYARDLGLIDLLGDDYRRESQEAFEQMVRDAREKGLEGEPQGRMAARAHYFAQGLGLDPTLDPADWRDFREALEKFRRVGNGIGVAQMHCYLGGYGVLGPVTEMDKDLMRKYLSTARRDKDMWGVADMLCQLSQIRLNKGEDQRPQMPPIKRFEK